MKTLLTVRISTECGERQNSTY